EQLDRALELRELVTGDRRFRPFGALQVSRHEIVALPRALRVAREPGIELPLELGVVLPDHPPARPAGPDRGLRMQDELWKDLLPELGDVVVGDRHLDETGADHLEDVLGLEVLGSEPNLDRRLAGLLEVTVELL